MTHMKKSNKCVHTEHCCIVHGCKYGEKDCPVEDGSKKQSFTCEYCNFGYNPEIEEECWELINSVFEEIGCNKGSSPLYRDKKPSDIGFQIFVSMDYQ